MVVKVESQWGFDVNSGGTLDATGTAGSPVVFTSYKDDSVGGDTNNVARFDPVDCDLGGWDATKCGCGHRHVGGQRLRR
jgi:hypothetical protein